MESIFELDQWILTRDRYRTHGHFPERQRLRRVIELRLHRLLPRHDLARVRAHSTHDGRQRALGDLLAFVERLAILDAGNQVDVLLHVAFGQWQRTHALVSLRPLARLDDPLRAVEVFGDPRIGAVY